MPNPTIDSSVATPGAEVHSADSQAGGTIDWRTSIPTELRTEKCLENVKDLPALVKGYVESQKYIGGAVKLPTDKSTPEEVKSFLTKLGVPAAPTEYKIGKPVLPEYVGWNDEVHSKILSTAHEAGLTPKQAKTFVEGLSKVVSGMQPDPNEILKKSETTLRGIWGDNFERNLVLSSRAVDHLAEQAGMPAADLHAALAETGAGAHPLVLKALSQLGNGMLEKGLIRNEETRIETLADAESKLKAIKSDVKHPYWDGSHPGHDEAVAEYRRLSQLIEANK